MGTGLRVGTVGTVLAIAVAGCGGGERQDKNEPSGTFDVDVVNAGFPTAQHVARQSRLRIRVRNAGNKTIPNVAVTVKGFTYRDTQQGLADANRPVWIVDRGPTGGDTAYVGTWALGALRPGRATTFEWRVTPIKPGHYNVSYQVAAGLDGKAKAQTSSGDEAAGTFRVDISPKPSAATVNPETGAVVRKPE
jgi:hypothetical protein